MSGKILVVDDQVVMLRLMSHPLEQEGFVVITAMTGQEALQKVQREQPDLVILDIILPDMNGIDVCRRMRQEMNLVDLPIILLSGRTEVATKIQGLEAGADEYVTKPVDPKEMTARVKSLLVRTRQLRQRSTSGSGPASMRRAQSIAVIGAKGGVGVTTLAANLSMALAMRGQGVIAVELRPYFGTLARHFGLSPRSGLSELLELIPKNITDMQVSRRLDPAQHGLQLLLGPQQLKEYREIQSEQAEAIMSAMLGLADVIVYDLPHMPSVANRAVLRAARQVLVVVEPDGDAVASAQALVELMRAWSIAPNVLKLVVVNRTQAAQSISAAEIQRITGCELYGTVTAAPDAAIAATNQGKPIVLSSPNSLVAGTLFEIADRTRAALAPIGRLQ